MRWIFTSDKGSGVAESSDSGGAGFSCQKPGQVKRGRVASVEKVLANQSFDFARHF
jgi:hypothetical protein